MSQPMLIFLDTEFSDLDAAKPELLSIGLVDEQGDSFYAEISDVRLTTISPWVWKNVVPLFTGPELPRSSVAAGLRAWIEIRGMPCRIVTDAPEFDFELMRTLVGDAWPANLASQPLRFDQYSAPAAIDARQACYQTSSWPEHHALGDAWALRAMWLAHGQVI